MLQLPIGAEGHYKGVIDLITMEALVWLDEELGAKWEVREIPENLEAEAEDYRHQLIDVLSTFDETILEKYVGDEEITVDDLQPRRAGRHHRQRDRARAQRHRVQEQGRPAPARRHRRCTCPAPATCRRSPACR